MEETLKTGMSFQGATATQLSSSTKSLPKPRNLASKGEEVLETAKAEMSQVREENTRLKMLLQKIESEYKSLKMHVEDNYFQQQQPEIVLKNNEESEEHELISLCLGTNNRNVSKECIGEVINRKKGDEDDEELKNGLKLGLSNYDQKSKLAFPSPDNNNNNNNNNSLLSTENKEEEEEDAGEKWQANNKGLKAMRNGDQKDDVSQINTVKRARVSVRARCSTPTMNDGCQWRKYGQKIAKSNPCPRAYYRCTVAASCPVRKQVQRCAEDTSILITTYEGTHNHPLPISATAMASTTSAAASMLLSGSSSSSPPPAAAPPNLTTFHGFNNNPNTVSQPFYMSNPSSSPPFPTITLDLTASPPSTSSSPFNNMAGAATTTQGLYPFTGLGYPQYSYSNVLPNLAYGTTPFFNRTQNLASFQTAGRPLQEHFFQSPLQKKQELMSSVLSSSSQQDLTETLTRAITSDPNFRSVIAAAISTMNNGGGSSSGHDQSNSNVEMLERNLKCDDQEKSTVRIPSPAPATNQAI